MIYAMDTTTHVSRLQAAPVVEAGSVPGYGAVFNAGLTHMDGRYHLFARAVRDGYTRNLLEGPRFHNYISDIVVFSSSDGHDYRFEYVLAEAGDHGVHCFEDPRVQLVMSEGVEHLVMTYTNLPPEFSGMPWRIGAHRLRWSNRRFWLAEGSGRLLGPCGIENKDAVIFNLSDGRVVLMQRIHPNMQIAVFDDLDHLWDAGDSYWADYLTTVDDHVIIRPSAGALGVGAGAPPVMTPYGHLLLFHERNAAGAYTMKAALLDPDTGRLIAMLDEPILWPELEWERRGDVNEVVFVQGVHAIDADTLYVVYGAADSHVGAAVVRTDSLLKALLT